MYYLFLIHQAAWDGISHQKNPMSLLQITVVESVTIKYIYTILTTIIKIKPYQVAKIAVWQ